MLQNRQPFVWINKVWECITFTLLHFFYLFTWTKREKRLLLSLFGSFPRSHLLIRTRSSGKEYWKKYEEFVHATIKNRQEGKDASFVWKDRWIGDTWNAQKCNISVRVFVKETLLSCEFLQTSRLRTAHAYLSNQSNFYYECTVFIKSSVFSFFNNAP